MTDNDPKPFVFHGHAIGVGAHFHRLNEHTGLDLPVPTLGTSVLARTGGVSQSTASNYLLAVREPVKKQLLAVRNVDTSARGYVKGSYYQTDISTKVEHSTWAERVHFELLSLRMETTHNGTDEYPKITIHDIQIKGLELGSETATVEIDEEPFRSAGTMKEIQDFWTAQSDAYRNANAHRFLTVPGNIAQLAIHHGHFVCSVVSKITLSNAGSDRPHMTSDGHTITWDDPNDQSVGFGKIILGEILIGESDRRITLARMQMGCPVGGSGSGGEGSSNGLPGH
jgi:hypothetical protein